jgi:hypothetical protein
MADSGEALEIGRVKPKKGGIVRRFDDQRVFEINYDISPYFPGDLENSVAGSRGDFFCSMIVNL